jgi:hypothetical protein
MKRLWITALDKDEVGVQRLMTAAKAYGLAASGHFWTDDLAKLAWAGAREELGHSDTGAWAILATPETLAKASIRQGLALLALELQSRKGPGFPVFLLAQDTAPSVTDLPTPLRGAQTFRLEDPALAVKLVAAANRPLTATGAEYRLALYPTQGLGLWFEVGPALGESWNGALFGVSVGAIDAHGIGPKGRLPERSTLEYPMQGLQLELGGTPHTAWAVRNILDPDSSYYLRVHDLAGSLVFGPFPEGDAAELFRIQLN